MSKRLSISIGLTAAAGFAISSSGSVRGAEASPRVYLLCSMTEDPVPGQKVTKQYLSAVFSAPAQGIDNDLKRPDPEIIAAQEFASYISRTYGVRLAKDRNGRSLQANCVTSADTGQGRSILESSRRKDNRPWIKPVLTDFIPPQFKPSAAELRFEAEQQQYEAQRQQYQRDLAANKAAEQKLAKQRKTAAASAQQAAKAKAEFDAQMKKFNAAQEEYKRQRALYELEYRKATGTLPPH